MSELAANISQWTARPVGTDPEFFITKPTGEVIPAFTFLPAQDARPEGDKGPYKDGFQAEVEVHPDTCIAFTMDNVRGAMQKLHEKALGVGGRLSFADSIDIPNLMEFPPEFSELGCSPSMNAYGEASVIPTDPTKILWRSAGCHIHLATPDEFIKTSTYTPATLIQLIDRIVGPIMTSLFQGLETPRRREMYGRAGEYRIKPYGVEWRVPPPATLMHPIVGHLVFDAARNTAGLAFNGDYLLGSVDGRRKIYQDFMAKLHHTAEDARAVINSCDVDTARAMLLESREFYEEFFNWAYRAKGHKIFNFVYAGALSRFNPSNYDTAWRIAEGSPGWMSHSGSHGCSVGKSDL